MDMLSDLHVAPVRTHKYFPDNGHTLECSLYTGTQIYITGSLQDAGNRHKKIQDVGKPEGQPARRMSFRTVRLSSSLIPQQVSQPVGMPGQRISFPTPLIPNAHLSNTTLVLLMGGAGPQAAQATAWGVGFFNSVYVKKIGLAWGAAHLQAQAAQAIAAAYLLPVARSHEQKPRTEPAAPSPPNLDEP